MIEGKCIKCGERPARVRLIRVVEGKTHTIHLCDECAAEVSPYQQQALSWQELIEKVLTQLVQNQDQEQETEETHGPQCPSCGTTFAAYRQSFLLGCSRCYTTFDTMLEAQLRRLHGATRHVGRTPQTGRLAGDETITPAAALKRDLELAVSSEDFERAAQLRDHIRQLEGEKT